MSDTTQTVNENPKPTTAPKVHTVHPTLDAAKAAVPVSERKDKPKLYCIACNGKPTRYTWAFGAADALRAVAEQDGYSVNAARQGAPVTKEAVAEKLASFTDEELAALGLTRAKKPRK